MERKDQREPYREQRTENWRGSESQNQDHRGQNRSERHQSGEMERSGGRQFEGREQWEDESGRAMAEGGRQFERAGGGYGSGRQGYAAGQSGQGYYGARPSEGTSTGYMSGQYGGGGQYSGGQYARSDEHRYFGQGGLASGQTSQGSWAENQYPRSDYGYGRQGYPGRGSSSAGQYLAEGMGGTYGGQTMGQYVGKGPKNYLRSDERIRDDVCRRLTEDPAVDASNIDVAVDAREVTLSGTVTSRDQRRKAEDCAEQIAGVSHVQNNIRVSRSEGWFSGDGQQENEIPRDETDSLISSEKVEGTAVYGSDRQKIGSIESVMLTKRTGKVAYAVLSFGGFLGLGTEHYPLPWKMLKYDTDLGGYVVSLTKDQLQAAPKYGQNDTWDWNDPQTSRRIDQYYNPWMF